MCVCECVHVQVCVCIEVSPGSTCVSDLWLVTISLICRTSEHVTPPTTNSSRRGWLLGRGRAELMNRLHGRGGEGAGNGRGREWEG